MKKYKHKKTGATAELLETVGYYIVLNNISYGYMNKCFIEESNDWELVVNSLSKESDNKHTTWNELTIEQKSQYKEYCDTKYGKTIMYCETGEPMYMDENSNLYNNQIIFDLLFSKIYN